jgi:hypothetical protein
MKQKAVCIMPVQLYGELAGLYDTGQVLEGERAALALERHPDYFRPAEPVKKGKEQNAEK